MLFIVRYLSSLLEFQFLDMKTIKNSVKLWQNKKGRIFVCHARQNDVFFIAGGNLLRDHPFKTLACLRGGRGQNLPNFPTDSTAEKLPTVGG